MGFLVARQGSSYRKPGAMMLFNSLGQHYGLLSGGCIEQQLAGAANRCLASGKTATIEMNLDSEEDDAEAWQAALGCGGAITVFIAPLNANNRQLSLDSAHALLESGHSAMISIDFSAEADAVQAECARVATPHKRLGDTAELAASGDGFQLTLQPPPRLFIAGAGVDAGPLAQLAHQLGWQVSINETRSALRNRSELPENVQRLAVEASHCDALHSADCIIIMHHNLALDAQWLAASRASSARYIGVLGPERRLQLLLERIDASLDDYASRLHGPCGMRLGGDTPASVALSILSDCHRTLADLQND